MCVARVFFFFHRTGECVRKYYGRIYAKSCSNTLINFAMGRLTRMGEKRKVYSVLVWKLGGKRQLRRPKRRWEYNNKVKQSRYRPGVAQRVPGS